MKRALKWVGTGLLFLAVPSFQLLTAQYSRKQETEADALLKELGLA